MTAGELRCLLEQIRRWRFSGKHLEIGTAAGGTLWQMMACFDAGTRPPFVVVDPMGYFPRQKEIVTDNLRRHGMDPSTVDFRQDFSEQALVKARSNNEVFDFMLIDGSHKILRVTQDLGWTELLRVGGVVAFHDFTSRLRGVKIAVRRFLRRFPECQVIAHTDSLLVVRKCRAFQRPVVSWKELAFARALTPLLQLEQSARKRLRRIQRRREACEAPQPG
jgi:hypothetical protein